MKLRLPPPRFRVPTFEVSGSALVLVLLVTALLTTIVVSFLSTSRIEQIAARNFSRQNAASGLAELATQQAMAKIQQGFTVTGNATTVITTQPGAIRQFVFSYGNSTSNSTIELFSGSANASTNGTANLNNLENPASYDSSASSNQWTITGDAGESIGVPLEEVTITENGTDKIIGRVAYYVDDEGAKLNLNQAAGTRATVNAAGRRPLDISALVGADIGNFTSIINATISDNSSIKNWGHFFRPEQAVGAEIVDQDQIPLLTTAVSSAANPLSTTTPWGTTRFFINELPIDSSGVDTIYDALTDQGLNDIFQGNFQDKYTELGLKQTAANYLQMRLPDVRTPSDSFTYLGGLLGTSNATTDFDDRIPINYQARSFFPIISEFALFAASSHPFGTDPSNVTWYNKRTRLVVTVVVEVDNPYDQDYPGGGWLEVLLDKASYTLKNGAHTWPNCGPQGEEAGDTWTNINTPGNLTESYYSSATDEKGNSLLNGTWNNFAAVTLPAIPKFSKNRFIFSCVHNIDLTTYQKNYLASNNLQLNDFKIKDPVDVKVKRIVLYAGAANVNGSGVGTEPDPLSIRDWVTGDEMEKEGFNKQIPVGDLYPNGNKIEKNTQKPTAQTFQRSDARIKRSRNMVQTGDLTSPWAFRPETLGNATLATPIDSKGETIPGDPSPGNSPTEALWPDPNNTTSSMADPILLGVANPNQVSSTSPADLGKVLTPLAWRTLRMQVQPASEAAAGLIPDWAMLDAMSFGPNAAGAGILDNFQPVNLNGQFHVPSGSPQPAPRNIGIKSLVKVLDNAPDKLADPMGGQDIPFANPIKFMGNTIAGQNDAETIANNIGEITWSNASNWSTRRAALGFPTDAYLLPSEVIEIKGVSDAVDQTNYNNSTSHFKWNEGRASALLPAVTTRSSFFTIYAYAQALDINQNIDSDALTKTMVEVEVQTPATSTTPAQYKVKKLYTQAIPLGQ